MGRRRSLPAPFLSCSSYLGEELGGLEEVSIPRIRTVNMDEVVGGHVEVVIAKRRGKHSNLEPMEAKVSVPRGHW